VHEAVEPRRSSGRFIGVQHSLKGSRLVAHGQSACGARRAGPGANVRQSGHGASGAILSALMSFKMIAPARWTRSNGYNPGNFTRQDPSERERDSARKPADWHPASQLTVTVPFRPCDPPSLSTGSIPNLIS
jgi:hypothetical protein